MNCRTFIYLLLLFSALPTVAQVSDVYWFHPLGKEEGVLNTANIYNVFQDSEGFTWIGMESGLGRYDGHTVVNFLPDPGDSTALSGTGVHGGFFEDSRKNIWFCTDGAIQCYNRQHGRFTDYQVKGHQGIPVRSGYSAIYLERDSFLWLRADGRTFYYFNVHSLQASEPLGRASFDIHFFPGVAADGHLRYLFSADGSKSRGLEVFELEADRALQPPFKTFEDNRADAPGLFIHNVVYDYDTAVWIAAESGIYRWDLRSRGLDSFLSEHQYPRRIVPYGPGHFIGVEMRTGLFLFDKKDGSYQRLSSRLLQGSGPPIDGLLYGLYADPAHNIWVQLDEAGLAYCDPDKIKFRAIRKFPGFDGALNYTYRAMAQDADGRIWCSTFFNGIFLLDEKGKLLRHYHPENPLNNTLNSRQVNHLLLDKDNQLWVASDKGVSYFSRAAERFIPVVDEEGKPAENVAYLHQLRNGEILASTLQQGVFRIFPGDGAWYLEQISAPGNESDYFLSIYEDSLGSIYIAHKQTELLIFSYVDGELKLLATKEAKGFVNGFYEDGDGRTLWVATSSGLAKLDKTNLNSPLVLFTTEDGLPSNEVQSLAAGMGGTLWMGTSDGIVWFDPDSTLFVPFSLADGAQSRYFNALSVLAHEDGTLWFGGDNGITAVDPAHISFLDKKPRIQVTEIKVNDKAAPGLADAVTQSTNVVVINSLVQPFNENTLSFSFVAIDYSGPGSTQLEYQLEGYEDDWVQLEKGEPGFARYPKLPPGEYKFRMRAANSDGKWFHNNVREISVKINPPWYQTWWARSLFLLLALLLLYAIYRYRVSQIRREEAFKRKEAEYRQLVAETETAVLRLQMNPHFIFNSMNSISSYILQKDIETANDYLNRFARLMRMILKLAERPFLAVSEELGLLKQYLDTEAMRFEETIDYQFVIGEGLDPDEAIIPTMILQPFIENAIWHGLAKKEGKKKITIAFEQEGGQLVCSVQDNGIGRAAAARGKASSQPHESKAVKITEKRLKLLEEVEGAHASLQIIDLEGENGMASGTRVVIRLPLL